MANRVVGARAFRGQRMKKHWALIGSGVPTAFTADSTNVNAGTLAFDEAWTVIRMIGEYIISPGGVLASTDEAMVGVAIGVAATDAVTVTAIADPINEPGYPWLYYAVHAFSFRGTGQDNAVGSQWVRRAFDIKSMRKVMPSQSLFICAQYLDQLGAPPLDIVYGVTRVLVAR